MESTQLPNIRSLSKDELINTLIEMGEKSFRAKQIYEWIWKKHINHFDEMTNVSKDLRTKIANTFSLRKLSLEEKQVSNDGTIKCAFKLYDGNVVEGVLIPTSKRMTACISSQVGCSLNCDFCATGKLKRMRNLTPDEIYDQVVEIKKLAQEHYNINLSNIVMMGMGEALLNYKNAMAGIDMITSDEGLGMSPKRITLSTAGIAKMMMQLADENPKVNLALSLHAANDEKRSKIMPINDSNSLENLKEAIQYFYKTTGIRPTYEYIIFKDFNDTLKDAAELADFCKISPCKVNIIEYNPIDGGNYQQADKAKVDAFAKFLEDRNIVVNIRRSRGKDIDAACGQLANKNELV